MCTFAFFSVSIATMFAHLCLQLRSSTASWYRALHVSQRADASHWIVHWSSAHFHCNYVCAPSGAALCERLLAIDAAEAILGILCWRRSFNDPYVFFRDLLLWMSFALSYFFRRSYI